jgi:hypothetical protein
MSNGDQSGADVSRRSAGAADRLPAAATVELTAAAAKLLSSIPDEVAPTRLANAFPHIFNRITELWTQPLRLDPYFDSLLIDQRGGRQGFSLGVALEILSLKEHYETVVYPKRTDIWDALHPTGGKTR